MSLTMRASKSTLHEQDGHWLNRRLDGRTLVLQYTTDGTILVDW